MTKAIWEGGVPAESNQWVEVEGNQYIPPDKAAAKRITGYMAFWKGVKVEK